MLDFTSALYLGLRHGSESLQPWDRLTLGVPAALQAPPAAVAVARDLASLQGCEASTLGPSTLHLFWDLLGLIAREPVAVLVDDGSYPIARWGVERAAARGVPVRSFGHHDVKALREGVRLACGRGLRPVVVTDGVCPACGRVAPLAGYLETARAERGLLIVDDTQALGVLGQAPGPQAPYGIGGGGSLRFLGVSGPSVLLVASLAKGFGAPLASLSGSRALVQRFEALSETRVHCSPPSVAALHAALAALALNRTEGDARRAQLLANVRRFRAALAPSGLRPTSGLFPVQTLADLGRERAAALHEALLRAGVRTVLHRSPGPGRAGLSFVLTALHTAEEVARAARTLLGVARREAMPVAVAEEH